MAALIARFVPLSEAERAALDHLARPTLRNWNGFMIGALRPTEALSAIALLQPVAVNAVCAPPWSRPRQSPRRP